MCHLDQHHFFSAFRGRTSEPALGHTMSTYLSGILPFVVGLEFASYATLTANIWLSKGSHVSYAWGYYAAALAFSIIHLFNAPLCLETTVDTQGRSAISRTATRFDSFSKNEPDKDFDHGFPACRSCPYTVVEDGIKVPDFIGVLVLSKWQ